MKTRIFCCTLALAGGLTGAAWADELSTSVMRPTPVTTGVVAGQLPGGQGATSYYVALDLMAGSLVTQLQVAGTPNTDKRLDLELLDANARATDSIYVMAGLDRKGEATKTFPIDRAGRYVVRLKAEGKETGTYCVLLGGSALPNVKAPNCPAPPAPAVVAAPPPPPPAPAVVQPPPAPPPPPVVVQAPVVAPEPPKPVAKPVEVITTRCEERLRVGSDFLFDFDRAEIRAEAAPALAELSQRITRADKAVLIEGHTDAKGTDSYNQGLSERRAVAVRIALVGGGLPQARLNVRGFGKARPVAPNQNPDGTDDPDGRQRNRRVEVVINTCN
jgi:outer membrane protein OmpA-like peptidoglycan-associated protein